MVGARWCSPPFALVVEPERRADASLAGSTMTARQLKEEAEDHHGSRLEEDRAGKRSEHGGHSGRRGITSNRRSIEWSSGRKGGCGGGQGGGDLTQLRKEVVEAFRQPARTPLTSEDPPGCAPQGPFCAGAGPRSPIPPSELPAHSCLLELRGRLQLEFSLARAKGLRWSGTGRKSPP